jgi:hypothetical protein
MWMQVENELGSDPVPWIFVTLIPRSRWPRRALLSFLEGGYGRNYLPLLFYHRQTWPTPPYSAL